MINQSLFTSLANCKELKVTSSTKIMQIKSNEHKTRNRLFSLLSLISASILATACSSTTTIKLPDASKLSVKEENINCTYRKDIAVYRCSAAGVITTLAGKTTDWHEDRECYTEYSSYGPTDTASEDQDKKTIIPDASKASSLLCSVVIGSGYNYKSIRDTGEKDRELEILNYIDSEKMDESLSFEPGKKHRELLDYMQQLRAIYASRAIYHYHEEGPRLINQALAILPSASGYFYRGLSNDSWQGQIADYTKAIEINPQYVAAYFGRGYAKNELKDYQGAIADFNKALEINPEYPDAYMNRGNAKYYLKDYQGAIADYNKAIEINPEDPDNFHNYVARGLAKYYLKDYQGAIADYNKAIDIFPQDAPLYMKRGIAKGELKDYKGAIADFSNAIEINPQFAFAYNNRGWSKYLQGDFQDALKDANKALTINPNEGALLDTRGLIKHALGQDRSACEDLNRAVSLGVEETSKYLQSEEGAWCRNMQ